MCAISAFTKPQNAELSDSFREKGMLGILQGRLPTGLNRSFEGTAYHNRSQSGCWVRQHVTFYETSFDRGHHLRLSDFAIMTASKSSILILMH